MPMGFVLVVGMEFSATLSAVVPAPVRNCALGRDDSESVDAPAAITNTYGATTSGLFPSFRPPARFRTTT